jgi:hypothetical protein
VSECPDPPFADRYDMAQHFLSRQLHTIGSCLSRAFSPNAEANFTARKKSLRSFEDRRLFQQVEDNGVEPMTSCMPCQAASLKRQNRAMHTEHSKTRIGSGCLSARAR